MSQGDDLALAGDLSCNDATVRGTLRSSSSVISTLTAPVTLTDPRTTGTTFDGALNFRGPCATAFSGGTRVTYKPELPGTNEFQGHRWITPAGALMWTLGNDFLGVGGAAGKNWWLFDNTRSLTPLYFPSGVPGDQIGSIRWGGGRVAYDESTDTMTFRAANVVKLTLTPTTFACDATIASSFAGDFVGGGAGKLIAFYGGAAVAKPTVTGSRALGFGPGGAGLSLLAALAALNLITDATVP